MMFLLQSCWISYIDKREKCLKKCFKPACKRFNRFKLQCRYNVPLIIAVVDQSMKFHSKISFKVIRFILVAVVSYVNKIEIKRCWNSPEIFCSHFSYIILILVGHLNTRCNFDVYRLDGLSTFKYKAQWLFTLEKQRESCKRHALTLLRSQQTYIG